MRSALAVGALGVLIAAAASCRCRAPVPPRPVAPPALVRVPIGGLERTLVVVRSRAIREEFCLETPPGGVWVSPADAIAIRGGDRGLLHVYPTAAVRPLALSSSTGRSVGLVTLEEDGRVLSVHELSLGAARRIVSPEKPYRMALYAPPAWLRGGSVSTGDRLELPPNVAIGAEPEFTPIADPAPVTVWVGGESFEVEVAHTKRARACGLMYRDRLEPGKGMLFLYPGLRELRFWMLNARFDIDVAYLAADGTIRRIRQLRAMDVIGRGSETPVRMALEVPGGWFAGHGVQVGDRVILPDRVRALCASAED